MLTLVLMSDTHGYHDDLDVPAGDILIHAGDMTQAGALAEVTAFDRFLQGLPHRHKIIIAGNHDWCFEREPAEARRQIKHAIYLEDEAVEIEGIRIYGSPWQPWFFDWAFNLPRGPELAAKWAKFPDNTELLITHGPPAGIGDKTNGNQHAGCVDLLQRVQKLKPMLHVFGHIHEGAGVYEQDGTIFVNASTTECRFGPVVLQWPGSSRRDK